MVVSELEVWALFIQVSWNCMLESGAGGMT